MNIYDCDLGGFYLLYTQTKVEGAIWAVALTIGPPYFSDETTQRQAQLIRVTPKDVFLNGQWVF